MDGISDTTQQLLLGAYRDFNARRLEAVLARMTPDVEWPNGMEGGYVYGQDGVRDYWTRQWAMINPHVEPMNIEEHAAGRLVVKVHQVVKDLAGHVLVDQIVSHAYVLRDGLIARMEIT